MAEQNLGVLQLPTPDTRPDYRGAIDPIDGRYEDPEAMLYFGEDSRVAYLAHVEAALAHTYADFGLCSRYVATEIENAGKDVTLNEVEAREEGTGEFSGRATKHDMVALVDAISDRVSDEAKPWVHAAATSYDPISTALALQFKVGVKKFVKPRVMSLGDEIASLTDRFADGTQIGRTHGQHGVPITFGFGTSRYLGRLGAALVEVDRRADDLQGKFSGAVGGYNASALINADPRKFEAAFLDKLGLKVCDYATQIVPGENLLRVLSELFIVSGVMAQIGQDMRNLQRTEIAEVGEHFDAETQRGSSAMVHKRNPITFENAVGTHRVVTGQLLNAQLNLVSDHQRDLCDSTSMRFYGTIPALVARTASSLTRALSKLDVSEDNLQRNLYMSDGAVGSEALQTVLRAQGFPNAYSVAKRIVNKALKEGRSFRDVVVEDDETGPVINSEDLPPHQRAAVIAPEVHYLGITVEEARRHVGVWSELKSRQLAA